MSYIDVPAETLQRLNETVRRAASLSPFYREAYSGIDLDFSSLADFQRLPLLGRVALIERVYDILVEGCVPITVSMSGGTTSAEDGVFRQVLSFRDETESRARRAVIEESYGLLATRPLLLHLMNLGHGYDTSSALDGVFQMGLERPFHFEAILSLLRHRFSFPGFTSNVEGIVGGLRLIKALTLLCVERGLDGAEFGIGLVSSSSNHLTSRWGKIIGDYWAASVDETYGLSEVPGLRARRCLDCGRFHFSSQAVVEVLDINGPEPVSKGIGRVIATSLYPNASMQPIIRYDTNDLIDVFGDCSATGKFGFEFLGRRKDVATLSGPDGTKAVLSPITLNEVLDGIPDVASEQFVFATLLGVRSQGVGYQKWVLRQQPDERRLTLGIELKWSPSQFRAEASALQDRVRNLVFEAAPTLADAVVAGELFFEVTLHEPGSTDFKTFV